MTHAVENLPVQNLVLDAIKSGQIKMRPKWFFWLKASILALGSLIIFLVLIYLAVFSVFVLHQTGVWHMPAFGWRGWYMFVRSLPWILVLLIMFFGAVLEILARQHTIAYRKPLLYSLIGIGALVGLAAFAAYSASSSGRHLPFAKRMPGHFGEQSFKNIHRGHILEIKPRIFLLQNRREEVLTIIMTTSTMVPNNQQFFIGDRVIVFGDRSDHMVEAYGIRKIQECEINCR